MKGSAIVREIARRYGEIEPVVVWRALNKLDQGGVVIVRTYAMDEPEVELVRRYINGGWVDWEDVFHAIAQSHFGTQVTMNPIGGVFVSFDPPSVETATGRALDAASDVVARLAGETDAAPPEVDAWEARCKLIELD